MSPQQFTKMITILSASLTMLMYCLQYILILHIFDIKPDNATFILSANVTSHLIDTLPDINTFVSFLQWWWPLYLPVSRLQCLSTDNITINLLTMCSYCCLLWPTCLACITTQYQNLEHVEILLPWIYSLFCTPRHTRSTQM